MNTLKFNQIEFNHIGEQPSMPLQEKSVTITENGTTEVVPDSGYALEKVEVNVGGIPDIKYYKVTQELIEVYASWSLDYRERFLMAIDTCSTIIYNDNGILVLMGMLDSIEGMIAFSVNFSKPISFGNPLKIGNMYGFTNFSTIDGTTVFNILNTLPEITKEEYFSFQ